MKRILFLLLFLSFLACKKEALPTGENHLGIVNISTTGSPEAQQEFEKGLLLLHSFEYADAREAFLKAQQLDPRMGMAYWGEAMTYNHNLWSEQDYDKGAATIAKMNNAQAELNLTELEKDLIQSAKILYKNDASKTDRDLAFSQYLQKLSKKYPDNHEVAAFYALSLLGSDPEGRDDSLFGKSALIAKGILEENPDHPGALHYLIHAYDDTNHAKLALQAADAYAVVAPDASHALHMPSHIYVALGMWDKVVSSNENAYRASLNRKEKKNLDNDARGYHAYHWLEYGYLQQERFEEAKKLLEDMVVFAEETPSKYARTHLVYLKGTYLVETDDWESTWADIPVKIEDLSLNTRTQYRFLEGMKAFKRGDLEALKAQLDAVQGDHDKESFLVTYEDVSFCSGASRDETTPSDLTRTNVVIEQLLALQAWMLNNPQETEAHLQRSIELDQKLSYSYGPPVIQKPPSELYADWLFLQNRLEEATVQYNHTLEKAPGRTLALKAREKIQQV